jgi:nicotinamidase-related amidase
VIHTTAIRRADGRGREHERAPVRRDAALGARAPGSPEAEIVPEIAVADGDIVLPRLHGVSPMHATELDQLRNLGVRTVVAVGVSVNIALTNLVFDAVNAGYQVVVPRDAVAGLPPEYVDAVFAHTLGLLATVTTTADVLAVWG